MEEKIFRIRGAMLFRKKAEQPFTKELMGKDTEEIREKILSLLGSKHKLKRKKIRIDEIKEISLEDITDPVLQQYIESQRVT